MNIILLGPQGSGKGTQAKLILKKLDLKYIEMGKQLRKYAKSDSLLSKEVSTTLQSGKLVPDEIVFRILATLLKKTNLSKGILFDGFPRKLDQYIKLVEILKSYHQKIDRIIILDISKKESIKRLSARRVHKTTGKVYNLITNPPPASIDKKLLLHRKDDTPKAVNNRLEIYDSQTSKIVSQAKKDGVTVTKINGERPIQEIHLDITSILSI